MAIRENETHEHLTARIKATEATTDTLIGINIARNVETKSAEGSRKFRVDLDANLVMSGSIARDIAIQVIDSKVCELQAALEDEELAWCEDWEMKEQIQTLYSARDLLLYIND